MPDPGPADALPARSDSARDRRRNLLRDALVLVMIALPALVTLLLAISGLVLGTESGSRWLIGHITARTERVVQIESPEGSFATGLRASRLRWVGGDFSIDVEAPRIQVQWSGLLRGGLHFTELAARAVDLQLAGRSEPLRPPGSLALPFRWSVGQLSIERLRVMRGEAAPLELEALAASGGYAGGRLRVDSGSVRFEGVNLSAVAVEVADRAPFPLKGAGEVRAQPSRFSLLESTLRERLSQSELTAQLSVEGELGRFGLTAMIGYAGASARVVSDVRVFDEALLGDVRILIEALDPARIVSGSPAANLSAEATLTPASSVVDFSLTNGAPGPLDGGRIPLASAKGRVRIEAEHWLIDGLQAQLPGGSFATVSAALDRQARQKLFGRELPTLALKVQLSAVDPSTLSGEWPAARITGSASLQGDNLELALSEVLKGEPLALEGSLHLGEDAIVLSRLQARTPFANIQVNRGRMRLKAPYDFDAAGTLAELAPAGLLARFGVRPPFDSDRRLKAAWQLQSRASGAARQLSVSVDLEPGSHAGYPFNGAVRAQIHRTSGDAALRVSVDGRLEWGGNRLLAKGALGGEKDRLQIDARLDRMGLIDERLRGALSVAAVLTGEVARPALAMRVSAAALAWGERADLADLVLTAEVADPAGVIERLRGNGRADAIAGERIDLRLVAKRMNLAGQTITGLSLRAKGAVSTHAFEGALRWAGHDLSFSGSGVIGQGGWQANLASMKAQGIFSAALAAPALIEASRDSIRANRLSFAAQGGELNLDEVLWSADSLRLAGVASALPLRPLIDWLEREVPNEVATPNRLAASRVAAAGSRGQDPRADAAERLRQLRLDARWQLSGASARTLDGRVSAALRPEAESGIAARDVVLGNNRIELALRSGEIDGTAELAIPSLSFSRRYTAPDWTLDGALFFSGQVKGRLDAPELQGTLKAERLNLFNRSLGWRLREGSIDARFDGRELTLKALRFASGEGAVTMAGKLQRITLPTSLTAIGRNELPLEGVLSLEATRLPVPLGPGQRLLLSGLTELTAKAGQLSWRGRLRADEGLIELRSAGAPELPPDVKVRGEGRAPEAAADPTGGWAPRVQADLVIDLGERLRVRGGGVDARLGGELALTGALPAAPRVRGVVETREGVFSAYGRQLSITRGLIRFNGDIDNPVLDIVAMRRNQPVEAGVAVSGTALAPRLRLVSEPDVPDAQKLSWLVLGSSLDDVTSAGQARALGEAAFTLLGRDDESLIATLTQRLGLDAVSVGASRAGARDEIGTARLGPPVLAGGSAIATAAASGLARQEVVTVSKRLSSRLTLSYERGLSGLWNLVRLQYDISNRLSLRAQSGSDTALDLLYFWFFN